VLEIEPGNADAMRGLARVAGWSGRLVTAERRWREVIARNPNDAAAWVGLSQTLRWQGRSALALDAARRAVAVAPTDRDAREALRWARQAVAPRAGATYVTEWDSDGNEIGTTSTSASARPFGPRTELRFELYRRVATADPDPAEWSSLGAAGTLWLQLEPGWGVSGTVGTSVYDVDDADPIPTYRLGVSSPGRNPVRANAGYAHYALDATALLIQREVYVDELSAGASWTPARRWTVSGNAGTARFTGRESGEENTRVNGSLAVARRIAGTFTLGAGFRAFSFERDLTDGYFDPDFYGLGELTARWLREWRHWSVNAELAPGMQQVRSDGDPSGSLRGEGSLSYILSPGRQIVLTGVFANTGLSQLSPGAGAADYSYRAVSLSGYWTF
jgi:hypothetical protein